MSKRIQSLIFAIVIFPIGLPSLMAQWEPPTELSREEIIETSEKILALPDIPLNTREDIFRINVLRLEWDVGGMVYEPKDVSKIPDGADGKKVGVFMLHGGNSDHRALDPAARLLAAKFGFKVVAMTYPGHLYLLDPSRDWPGDTIKPDGSVRTPIWNKDKPITKDQYEVVEDRSMRPKYGTITLACAKEGTEFHARITGNSMAFEETGKALLQRHFPPDEYSVYIHGHSTGGPHAYMLTQRVENIMGVLGIETSPFGYIYRVQSRPSGNPHGKTQGELPFNCLKIDTWRGRARYSGPEALKREGPEALMRLPMLMEEVYERWENRKTYANFKAVHLVHFGGVRELAKSARATAKRLDLSTDRAEELVEHYIGYTRELSGPDVKPVPPIMWSMTSASAGHEYETYRRITLPMYAAMDPPPKIRLVPLDAGIHGYTSPEPDLPMGPFPAVGKLWRDAIMNGYYVK